MSLDLEDRLRAMYAAVAATTAIDVDELMELRERPLRRSMRRTSVILTVAAAAAVLVTMVVVVARRDASQSASALLKDRPYAIPLAMANGYGFVEGSLRTNTAMPGFADTPARSASLTFLGPRDQAITVMSALDSGTGPLLGSSQENLVSGVVAQLTDAGLGYRRTLAWVQPGGNRVSIRADGITTAELVDIANTVWWVTEPTFNAVTAKNGFGEALYDPWTPPGDDRGVQLRVEGSLQSHFVIGSGSSGFDVAAATKDVGCGAQGLFRFVDDRTAVLRSFSPVEAFRVHLGGGKVIDVAAGVYPGLPNARFATVQVPDAAALRYLLQVDCIGGQS